MCFITAGTLAAVSAAAAVAGAGISAVGAIQQGNAAAEASRQQAKMNEYQAVVAQNNAQVAEQNATRAEQVAAVNAEAKSREVATRMGRVKAGLAASGVDVNTGTALDVQAGTRMVGKLDTDTLFSNELLKAYGYRSEAANYRANADMLRYRGGVASARAGDESTSGYLKAGGGLLSTVSSLPLKWLGGTGGGYDVNKDYIRTAGDRDLGGYNS